MSVDWNRGCVDCIHLHHSWGPVKSFCDDGNEFQIP